MDWPTEPFLINYPEPTDIFSEWVERTRSNKKTTLKNIAIDALSNPVLSQQQKEGIAQSLLLLDHVDEDSVISVLEFLEAHGRSRQYEKVLKSYLSRLRAQYDLEPSDEFLKKYNLDLPVTPIKHGKKSSLKTREESIAFYDRPILTVTQFEVRGDSEAVSYLGLAFTEEIISRLAHQNWFTVNTSNAGLYYSPPGVGMQRPESVSYTHLTLPTKA